MSKEITKREILEPLIAEIGYSYSNLKYTEGHSNDLLEIAEKAMEEYAKIKLAEWQAQQPIKEQGWVSVREDKPSPYTTVLICFEKESKGMNNIIRTGRWCGDSFIINGDYPLLTNIITHWQPLPEPPKK